MQMMKMRVEVDQKGAAALGLRPFDATRTVQLAMGSWATVPIGGDKAVNVRFEGTVGPNDLATIGVHKATGEVVPLAVVAKAQMASEPEVVYRVGRARAVLVWGSPMPGVSVARAIEKWIAIAGDVQRELKLGEEYRWVDVGDSRQ
jgi:multidrug efflux pump subunit AcrB